VQLRDRYREFTDKGASIVAIGMGTPDKAARFRQRYSLPFVLLVDNDGKTYEAAGLRRGSLDDVIGPRVWARGIKGLATGRGVALPREDPFQLGGTAVIRPDGSVAHHHVAEHSADNTPVEGLLEAIQR
jgi:hypothetical protein